MARKFDLSSEVASQNDLLGTALPLQNLLFVPEVALRLRFAVRHGQIFGIAFSRSTVVNFEKYLSYLTYLCDFLSGKRSLESFLDTHNNHFECVCGSLKAFKAKGLLQDLETSTIP